LTIIEKDVSASSSLPAVSKHELVRPNGHKRKLGNELTDEAL
jgi:hypothetical protein